MKEPFLRDDGIKDFCSYSPDVLFGVDIGGCCEAHDEHYKFQEVSREEADKQLEIDIEIKFIEADKPILGWLVSNIYFKAVRIFGGCRW